MHTKGVFYRYKHCKTTSYTSAYTSFYNLLEKTSTSFKKKKKEEVFSNGTEGLLSGKLRFPGNILYSQ